MTNPPPLNPPHLEAVPASLPPNGSHTGRSRLGFALTTVIVGLLSFVVGLTLFSSSKTDTPTVGEGPTPKKAGLVQAESKEPNADPEPNPKPDQKPDAKPDTGPPPVPWPPESVAFAGTKVGDEWSANGLGMKFCWCPAGTFLMGDAVTPSSSDGGQVEVRFAKGFWLAKYEATQEQWEKLMGTNITQQLDLMNARAHWLAHNWDPWWERDEWSRAPRYREKYPWEAAFGEGPDYPMYYVNHLEATDFCIKLTEQERKAGRLPPGWEFRLPTSAQWEYACRAGTKTSTAFGDKLTSNQANYDGTMPDNGAAPGPKLRWMQPVGSYKPNGWGMYDMHGNAAEWCRDWFGNKWPAGGLNPEVKYGEYERVVRGGSWRSPGLVCRSAYCTRSLWSTQDFETGFRVALVPLDPQPRPAPEQKPNPNPLPPGTLVNSIGMRLAPIPAGKFVMGSPVDEPYRQWLGRDEADYEEQHPVTIREPFYLGVYLVTQGQYDQLMRDAPGYQPSYFSHQGGGKGNVKEFKDTERFPRDTVSWEDAAEFCRRLSELPEEKKRGRVYRLPTEEEWEYACRAGTSTATNRGRPIGLRHANIGNNLGRTTPVGDYNYPNKFGLYDMYGNLSQWCDGLFAPYQLDLRNPDRTYSHVVRGSAWSQSIVTARSAARRDEQSGTKYTGFRVALSVGVQRPTPPELTLNPKPLLAVERAAPVPRDKIPSNPEVIALLGKMKSTDWKVRSAAAQQLINIEADANRVAVAAALEVMMDDENIFVISGAASALCVWGDKKNVPGMIRYTTDKNIHHRGHACLVLAALKDERGAEAVAERLTSGTDRGAASEFLKKMGPIAEPAVLKRLKHPMKEVRIEACKILAEMGTDKCVAPLEEATRDMDPEVAKAAREALLDVLP
jgi:formylglycine-generating enzyme required for sulfatase activity